MLKYEDFKGVYALIPACATPDAHMWSSTDTINVEAQRSLVSNLIEDGADGIITEGTAEALRDRRGRGKWKGPSPHRYMGP
jgi:hypothetical protein